MAIITCPECKKKISDTAESCPKCGYKLTPEKIAEIKQKEKKQFQKGYIILSWIFGLFFLFTGFGMLADSVIASIPLFIISFLLIPIVRKLIYKKTGKHLSIVVRAILILAAFTVFGILINSQSVEIPNDSPFKAGFKAGSDKAPRSLEDQGRKWYEGGSLHNSGALEWQKADYANKLATCADFIYRLHQKKLLKDSLMSEINSVEDIKPLAIQLVKQLDIAFKKDLNDLNNSQLYTNQNVSDTAAILVSLMGWNK